MRRLIGIEWLKLRQYRTFWTLLVVYFVLLGMVGSSGRLFVNLLTGTGKNAGGFNPAQIPLYDFPDVWQNLTYVASFFKLFPAFIVLISVTNESSYRTLRQNVIDGLSKREFLLSKLGFIFLLSGANALFVLLIGLVMGGLHSSVTEARFIFQSLEFIPVHFLEIFAFLVLTLLVGLVLKKSGLSIGLLLMYVLFIEPLLSAMLPDRFASWYRFLPVKALNNLIPVPFPRYVLMEIRDYVTWESVLIVVAHLALYLFLCDRWLARRDL